MFRLARILVRERFVNVLTSGAFSVSLPNERADARRLPMYALRCARARFRLWFAAIEIRKRVAVLRAGHRFRLMGGFRASGVILIRWQRLATVRFDTVRLYVQLNWKCRSSRFARPIPRYVLRKSLCVRFTAARKMAADRSGRDAKTHYVLRKTLVSARPAKSLSSVNRTAWFDRAWASIKLSAIASFSRMAISAADSAMSRVRSSTRY
jgi:hypothetical protein